MAAFLPVAGLHIDMQGDFAVAGRGKGVADAHQITGHHGKKIARFGKGIMPGGEVQAAIQLALFDQVAV